MPYFLKISKPFNKTSNTYRKTEQNKNKNKFTRPGNPGKPVKLANSKLLVNLQLMVQSSKSLLPQLSN